MEGGRLLLVGVLDEGPKGVRWYQAEIGAVTEEIGYSEQVAVVVESGEESEAGYVQEVEFCAGMIGRGVEDTEGFWCLIYGMSWPARSGAIEGKGLISLEGCGWILFLLASDC